MPSLPKASTFDFQIHRFFGLAPPGHQRQVFTTRSFLTVQSQPLRP
jgi:hypothetical protein